MVLEISEKADITLEQVMQFQAKSRLSNEKKIVVIKEAKAMRGAV